MNAENDLKMWLQRVADSPETLRPIDLVNRLLDPEIVPNGCTLHGMVAWLMTQRVSDRVRTLLVQWSAAHPESVQAQPEVQGEYTPGPWMAVQSHAPGEGIQQNGWIVVNGVGWGDWVAQVLDRGSPWPCAQEQANSAATARLIAAAPDMLGILRTILMRLDLEPKSAVFPCSAMREDIRKVIAAATK